MKKLLLLSWILIATVACRSSYAPADTDIENLRVSEKAPYRDNTIEDMIKPYADRLNAEMGETIGQLSVDLTKTKPESTLGNWLSDILYDELRYTYDEDIAFAVQNYGGIRVPMITAGPVTIGEIYEIMPFDNKVSIISGTGAQVQVFLDHIAADGGWPISQGLSLTIENGKAVDVMIGGEPIDDSGTYRFVVPDYIANGGSGSSFLLDYERKDLELLIRDIFIQHLRQGYHEGHVETAEIDGRLKTKE